MSVSLKYLSFSIILLFNTLTLFSADRTGTSAAQILQLPFTLELATRGPVIGHQADPTNWYWQPAALGSLVGDGGDVTVIPLFMEQLYTSTRYFHSFSPGKSVGISLNTFQSGDILKTSIENPYGDDDTFTYTSGVIAVSYGQQMLDNVYLGGTVKYIQESTLELTANSTAIDLGLIFHMPDIYSSFSIVLGNVGEDMRLSGSDLTVDNTTEYATRSWELPVQRMYGWELRLSGAEGLFKTKALPIQLGVGLKDSATDLAELNISIRTQLLKNLNVIVGQDILAEHAKLSTAVSYRWAVSAHQWFSLGYAYVPWYLFGDTHYFTLGFGW